jgi:hypothetical protein
MPLAKPGTKIAKKASKKVARKVASTKALRKTKLSADKASAPAVKAVKKPARTKTTKSSAAPAKRKSSPSTSVDFAAGTDMHTAFEEVLRGGASRAEVSKRLADMWKEAKTRNGNDKPVSTILNHVIRRARMNGYEVQQTWQLVKKDGTVPAPDVSGAVEAVKERTGTGVSFKDEAIARKGTRRRGSAERNLAEKAGVVKKVPVKTAKKAVRSRTKA